MGGRDKLIYFSSHPHLSGQMTAWRAATQANYQGLLMSIPHRNPLPNWHLPAEIDDLNISFGVLSCFLYLCKNDYKRIIFICLFVTSPQISCGNLGYFDTCRQVNEKTGRLICPRGHVRAKPTSLEWQRHSATSW